MLSPGATIKPEAPAAGAPGAAPHSGGRSLGMHGQAAEWAQNYAAGAVAGSANVLRRASSSTVACSSIPPHQAVRFKVVSAPQRLRFRYSEGAAAEQPGGHLPLGVALLHEHTAV